jgi:hypothetical protein
MFAPKNSLTIKKNGWIGENIGWKSEEEKENKKKS